MDNEVKEILMQLVDTTNKLAEGQKRTDERLDKMSADITDMKKDITQLKTDVAGMKEDITEMKEDITEMKEDITEMKEDITELKRETKITRVNVNHNGEVLEQMVKDLAPLNMLNVKY